MNGIVASRVSATDGSSRVPVPLPEYPYEAIRRAYLVGTDIESEPFEDPIKTKALNSPHTVAPPTSLPDSTPPTLVPILRRTARIVVRVPPAMSLGLSIGMAEVTAMSDSAFHKMFRSSYESSSSLSPLDLPLHKRYREDEGPTIKDEDPAAGYEGLTARDEGHGMGVESPSLGGEEVVPEGQPRAALVVETAVGEPLGLGYGALRRQFERPERVSALRQPTFTTWIDPEDGIVYIDVPTYPPPAPPAQTPPSPKWSSGLLPISPAPSIVPSPILSPMILLTVPSPVALPAIAETERYDRDIGELFTRSGAVRDEIFTQRYQFRSLEHEQERVVVTFGVIWRPVLALESWARQTDAQRAALWHAISNMQRENRELRLQLVEERRARLDLAKIVNSMRRG
ncbi:hypothetical protein Tco_1160500 [Tanacetum coccineum]